MDILQRRLTPRIEHSLKTDRVPALMGPRQAGKTTLVRHLLQCDREIK
ncbi:MAG TPA: ATP-binding protein [Desulfobulbus sp.]|nr:ATP-binding protein [Desulfobulbus sp.]